MMSLNVHARVDALSANNGMIRGTSLLGADSGHKKIIYILKYIIKLYR